MCVSLFPAHFSETIIYGGAFPTYHVLGYENKAQNLNGGDQYRHLRSQRSDADVLPANWSTAIAGQGEGNGNALFLPFPAVPGTMNHTSIIDTSDCQWILKDMQRAVQPQGRSSMRMLGGTKSGALVFDHDIYTIVMAQETAQIAQALNRVPKDRRPARNDAIFTAYDRWYPGWTKAFCCFSNEEAAQAAPMLWHYKPMYEEVVFIPTLDAHDGNVPRLEERVGLDHTIVLGSPNMSRGKVIEFSGQVPGSVLPYITDSVIGTNYNKRLPNGDFIITTSDIALGNIDGLTRVLPPGAQQVN